MKKIAKYFLLIIISMNFIGCNKLDVKEDKLNIEESTEVQESSIEEDDNGKEYDLEANYQVAQAQAYVNNDNDTEDSENKISQTSDENIKKVIVIDPGHASHSNLEKEEQSPGSGIMKIKDGGGAQGTSTGTPEYVVNMNVATKLKYLLEAKNYTVIMTKTSNDISLGNIERANIGNDNNASLVIRIHCDSADNSSALGASMLVPAKCGYAEDICDISRKYGEIVLSSLVESGDMKNRGISVRDDMTGFNWSKVPVILVEMGFMSNPEEDSLLSNDNYQNKLASGLCDGIEKCFQ
ncbi:N-acetylmuramoyl-L-alanine amidase family protein [Clostridium butyricum]|uniref:N-acetylmuramoyl-L-alanine amidase family protein n=1 Tax=Clostridium butyricum TaxID=1492 RepID=UPI002907EBF1|nr:N-acetylmuramoyl-L-alanine amidase [Clostridium butyricum]MDU5722987.1 N-acetylmuramoyl-L-alanine amidase [Clostridium butyricum]MDU5821094.1 N-acetylmuramoyl-L-alanine amidase [Clostridium butyricum]